MINSEKELLDKIDETLTNIKEKNALTHCITNSVTINDCANAVLAIGGSQFMAEDAEEKHGNCCYKMKWRLAYGAGRKEYCNECCHRQIFRRNC